MSKISREGYEQIKVIKNALDSMFDKLEKSGNFNGVKDEFDKAKEKEKQLLQEDRDVKDK